MLLDVPARLLYRHGVNLYGPMRLVCTTYRCIVRIAAVIGALLVIRLLINSGALRALIE